VTSTHVQLVVCLWGPSCKHALAIERAYTQIDRPSTSLSIQSRRESVAFFKYLK